MNSIQQRFDQILLDHLERLSGTQTGVAGMPLHLVSISLVIFLAEQAANERDQLISAEDRYTRDSLLQELTEIGLGSESEFNQTIQEMFEKTYIHQDDAGRLVASELLVETAQLLESVLPTMPGLNLIAYMTQTLDEAVSGRKTLEDAASQFDQTLELQGVSLSGTPDQTVVKKGGKNSISAEASERVIKSIHKEADREPTRQSKVLSSKSQMQIKTVAFGKATKIQDPDPQDPQQEAITVDSTEKTLEPKDTEIEIPAEPSTWNDPDVPADGSDIQNSQDSEKPIPKNDQEDSENSPELSSETESAGPEPERDQVKISVPDDEISPVSAPGNDNLQTSQEQIDDNEAKPDELDTADDIIKKEISKFETDLAMQCPICKSANIISELTTKGKQYYKCPNIACNFISWGKPFHNECPRCHNPFLIEAQKNGVMVLKCPRATCNYWQGEQATEVPSAPSAKTQIHPSKSKTGSSKRRRRVVKRRVVRRKK